MLLSFLWDAPPPEAVSEESVCACVWDPRVVLCFTGASSSPCERTGDGSCWVGAGEDGCVVLFQSRLRSRLHTILQRCR